jgi:hypothetical protein
MKKLLFLLYLSLFITELFAQSIIYVNYNSGNDGSGDGSSGNPYKTFHKGYTSASSGDIIDLSGTFDWTNTDETGDANTTGYSLEKNLTIRGHGADQTIIQAAATANSANRRVFTIGAVSGVTIVFEDLTIRYGKVWDGQTDPFGGGVVIENSCDVTFTNCFVHHNYSWQTGGGIDSFNSIVTVINSTISDNHGYHGGGISSKSSTFTITNSTICNNYAEADGYGGGLNLEDGGTSATLTNCTIVNNESSNAGGGISIAGNPEGATLIIKNTILANNTGNGSANDFDYYSGTITDNGYNIIEYSTGYSWTGTGDITGNQTNLNLSSTLENNNTINGTPTLKTTSGSVAIDAGNSLANGSVSIPSTDQRGASRNSNTDIGAYEYYDDSGSLPVELNTFTGKFINESVELKWETATEVNNYGFEIERKNRGSGVWEKIGFVQGNGTTNSPKNYEFTDSELPNSESVDYRLKQIDNDGKFTYSKVITVDLSTITNIKDEVVYEFALEQNYPNPFNPTTTINFTVPTPPHPSPYKGEGTREGLVLLRVYDILGREVATLVNQKLKPGNYEVQFNASSLSSGMYFYRIDIGNRLTSVKKMILIK